MDLLVNAQSQAVVYASCTIKGSDCPTKKCELTCSCYPGRQGSK